MFGSKVLASDNVLQAIQVDGNNDSYNIILKSDDVAELKKTIQAPNKMVLNLKGIRASKTINTIYNNTSNVDSVVVEPTGEDAVKISIQADNVSNAGVHFDTLKTPLGVLNKNSGEKEPTGEVVLSGPVNSYRPVYDNSGNLEDEDSFSMAGATSSLAKHMKKALKGGNMNWMITTGLFILLLVSGIKSIKGKDNDIKVGLSQSLKEREVGLYRGLNGVNSEISSASLGMNQGVQPGMVNPSANYGLKAYQNGTRSPYVTSEVQRPKVAPTASPNVTPQAVSKQINAINNTRSAMQNSIRPAAPQATATAAPSAKQKTTNIDSIKFLESMTKIYEKNGRTDLAKGLKANMKKAKTNLV